MGSKSVMKRAQSSHVEQEGNQERCWEVSDLS